MKFCIKFFFDKNFNNVAWGGQQSFKNLIYKIKSGIMKNG
jgi:hypothetical protein